MRYSIRYRIARLAKKAGLRYDPEKSPEVLAMRKEISSLGGGSIQFSVSRDVNGDWVAESVNVPGIITGGTAADNADEMIKDAIFTYYAIPPEYCVNEMIREASEPAVTKQEVYATA